MTSSKALLRLVLAAWVGIAGSKAQGADFRSFDIVEIRVTSYSKSNGCYDAHRGYYSCIQINLNVLVRQKGGQIASIAHSYRTDGTIPEAIDSDFGPSAETAKNAMASSAACLDDYIRKPGELAAQAAALKDALSWDKVRVSIRRSYSGTECVSGYLEVNGKAIAYTVERPDIGNINDISAIPAGSYHSFVRYDHVDAWRMQLVGVPGRKAVQIHVGNWPTKAPDGATGQSKGCILIGDRLLDNPCGVGSSQNAYERLKQALYGGDGSQVGPERSITVEVRGP